MLVSTSKLMNQKSNHTDRSLSYSLQNEKQHAYACCFVLHKNWCDNTCMSKGTIHQSIKFSIIPVVLATSCCLTTPGLAVLGITFYEPMLYELRWLLRLLALLVITLSLTIYFRKYGIISITDYRIRIREVLPTAIQTYLIALFIYVFVSVWVVPVFCSTQNLLPCGL